MSESPAFSDRLDNMSDDDHTWLQPVLLTIGTLLAYWWLHQPSLSSYSVQAFAVIALIYFGFKLITKQKLWHVIPGHPHTIELSIETALVNLTFLLLIGATGNASSWFYPLTYIQLFLIVFSSGVGTSIWMTMLLILFHYGLSPAVVQHELMALSTLPIVMLFFLFARHQHQAAVTDQLIIDEEERELAEIGYDEDMMRRFLVEFLSPKLEQLKELSQYSGNTQTIHGQITLMKIEIEKLLRHISQQNT